MITKDVLLPFLSEGFQQNEGIQGFEEECAPCTALTQAGMHRGAVQRNL